MAAAAALLTAAAAGARYAVDDDQWTTGSDVAALKVLSDRVTGESVAVLVTAGGGVDALRLAPPGGAPRDVLWTHRRNATEARANPTWKGRVLLPYANRIGGATYQFNGSTFRLPINDVAGLNNSLHGLLWDRAMTVAAARGGDDAAEVALEYTFDGGDAGYPFRLAARVEYRLSGGRFEMTVRARNADAGGWPLPFYNGWHPYFVARDVSAARIVLDNCTAWGHVDVATGPQYPPPRHSSMVPTGHLSPWRKNTGGDSIGGTPAAPTYMDDEVRALDPDRCSGGFRTRFVDGDREVLLHAGPSFQWLQIFTGAMAQWGEPAVVLEPLSAQSDAYNNHDGLHVVPAGGEFVSRIAVQVLR